MLNQLGTEETLLTQYPTFYNLMKNSIPENKPANYDFSDGADIYDITESIEGTNSHENMSLSGEIFLTECSPCVLAILELYVNGTREGLTSVTKNEVQSLTIECSAQLPQPITDSDDVYARITCYYNTKDAKSVSRISG